VLEAAFVLLEVSSPSRRIFIGSHSLPPSLVRRIGPSSGRMRCASVAWVQIFIVFSLGECGSPPHYLVPIAILRDKQKTKTTNTHVTRPVYKTGGARLFYSSS
jgi:hypothetical protein